MQPFPDLEPRPEPHRMRLRGFCVLSVTIPLVIAALWLAAVALFPPVDTSQEAFSRLREGMTLAEVETVFGGPAGDYRTDKDGVTTFRRSPPCVAFGSSLPYPWNVVARTRQWFTDDAHISVDFDTEDRVVVFDRVDTTQHKRPLHQRVWNNVRDWFP